MTIYAKEALEQRREDVLEYQKKLKELEQNQVLMELVKEQETYEYNEDFKLHMVSLLSKVSFVAYLIAQINKEIQSEAASLITATSFILNYGLLGYYRKKGIDLNYKSVDHYREIRHIYQTYLADYNNLKLLTESDNATLMNEYAGEYIYGYEDITNLRRRPDLQKALKPRKCKVIK